jgi:hypothetical protein
MNRWIAATALAVFGSAALGQTLSGITVEPAVAKVGQEVKITGSFDSAGNPNCNLRVEFGDGKSQNFKINQDKDVPLITTHRYAKAGTYKVSVLPRTAMPMIKCKGADQVATLKVEAAAPAAKPVAAAAPACPAGWTLAARSVNKKTGAFTCTAKPGTDLPAAKLACPGKLGYFENKAKGQIGCRP